MKPRLLLILFLLSAPILGAQNIQVTVSKKVTQLPTTPYSYLEDPLRYFSVVITNGEGHPQSVYLSCEFRFNGRPVFFSKNDPPLRELVLPVGTTLLTPDIYDQQFGGNMTYDLDALVSATGASTLSQLNAITHLPEGDYELSIDVHPFIDETTPTDPMSDASAVESFEIVYSATAPELITPLSEQINWGANSRADSRDRNRKSTAKTTKREDDFSLLTSMGRTSSNRSSLTPQRKLTFRWTPVITSSGNNPQFLYTLKIVAVMPNQNAQDAIDHNPVVTTATTSATYCIIDTLQDMKYQFEQGSTYAVQVRAEWVDKNKGRAAADLDYIELANEGKSQVVTFSWGRAKYSISYNEIKAPLDTAWVELRYRDNLQQLLRATTMPEIVSPRSVVNPDTFDIAFSRPGWTPVSGPSINGVQYTARIYHFRGEEESTLQQQPITQASQMVPGKYYYIDVEAAINYHYQWDSVRATVHYVNGIEADTEADTVHGEGDATLVRHVGKVFRYGSVVDKSYRTKYETPRVGLRLAADYLSDSACIHLNWYHHYKSKAGEKRSSDKQKSRGLFHTVVYRSVDDGPFVGIASLPSECETFVDRDIYPGQVVRYFVKLHITQYKCSTPSNTIRIAVK